MAQELLLTPLYNDANIQDYWRFEGNATASKGSHNGTATSITFSSGNGKFGQGAGFNGSSSKINVGNLYSGGNDFTINCWIKTSTTGVRQTINAQGAAVTNNGMFFRVETSNVLNFELYSGVSVTSSSTVTDGSFHMVTAVNASKVMQLYIDGVTNGSSAAIPSINISASSDYPNIGVEQTQNWFNGAMDDPSFFTRALTAQEIRNLFYGFPGGAGIFPAIF